jgi:AcrR family transcriptional regulator
MAVSARSKHSPGPAPTPPGRRPRGDTRQQILDVALDLFTRQGYDKTSLRDIAEVLGFTKAALYYHFERKEDIFIELHFRFHELVREALDQLDELSDDQARADAWPVIIDKITQQVVENPQLFLLQIRNAGAIQAVLDHERNQAENASLLQRGQRLLTNPAIPLDQRIRMIGSLSAAVGTLLIFDTSADVPMSEIADEVRNLAHTILKSH